MLISLVLLQACTFKEDLNYYDLKGTVKIPVAATKFVYGFDDEQRIIDDIRGLGPVYLGVYSSVQDGLYPFPHPEMGPILAEGQDGNSYPYGGNTIGRFDWACYEQLVCKTVTGRYESYADILDFYETQLDEKVRTYDGHIVGTGEEFRERCFEYEYGTGDHEMLFIGVRDFRVEGDFLVGDATIPHVAMYENMKVWGWMDMPSPSFDFNTCDPGVGDNINYYNENYDLGTNAIDVLNYPGKYIDFGDWVAQTPVEITDPLQPFELELGFHYVDEE
jgi:hypothetical protein